MPLRKPAFPFPLLLTFALFAVAASLPRPARANTSSSKSASDAALTAEIDTVAREVMAESKAPSISLAVVRDGAIFYAQAYGDARLTPEKVPATPATRYGIGSVSKQFCAAAILLLEQAGALHLDDPVGKYVPNLTSGDTITIRQVLGHTSGYRDYWPQDYVPAPMLKPTTPDAILDGWVRRPLDFDPGTAWQYSNTNYTVAGLIVERLAKRPLLDYLRAMIFEPLGMKDVTECDTKPLAVPDAAPYTRVALGPVRPAPKEGSGWLFAAGELAMTPTDLARWDIALINRKLLSNSSLAEMFTPGRLPNGVSTSYGLGVAIRTDAAGRPVVEHSGEISGMTTENIVWPTQRTALAIVVNADWTDAYSVLMRRLTPLLLPADGPDAAAREFFTGLQGGTASPAVMSENLQAYLTSSALHDAALGLGPLGPVRTFRRVQEQERGGLTLREYQVICAHGTAEVVARVWPDGKFEQYNVVPREQ